MKKICTICETEFEPTGNAQKICVKCKQGAKEANVDLGLALANGPVDLDEPLEKIIEELQEFNRLKKDLKDKLKKIMEGL